MDDINASPLDIDELYELCMSLFVGDSLLSMRHPSKDWNGFVSDLQGFLKQEKMVWNPIKKKLCQWIDIDKLHSIYAGTGVRRTRPRSYSKQPATAKNAIPCTSAKPLEPTSVHNEESCPVLGRIYLIPRYDASLHHTPRIIPVCPPSLRSKQFGVQASVLKEGYHLFTTLPSLVKS
jgi:hypothetical protein